MTILKITDGLKYGNTLSFGVRELIKCLGESAENLYWEVHAVNDDSEKFDTIGKAFAKLKRLKENHSKVDSEIILEILKGKNQVVWGEFIGFLKETKRKEILIRAIDSSWFEVETDNEIFINRIQAGFKEIKITS